MEGQGGGGGDRGVRAGARGRRSLRGALIARGRWCEPLTKVVDMTLGARSLVVSATYLKKEPGQCLSNIEYNHARDLYGFIPRVKPYFRLL